MSVSIGEKIAAVLKTNVAALNKRVFDHVPDAIVAPAAIVAFPAVTYDADMSGDHELTVPVHVLITRASEKNALRKLEPYVSPVGASSIKAALESDRTLAGAVSTLRVTRAEVSPFKVGDADYIGATFTVECYFTDLYH